jgi:hypothetical protein
VANVVVKQAARDAGLPPIAPKGGWDLQGFEQQAARSGRSVPTQRKLPFHNQLNLFSAARIPGTCKPKKTTSSIANGTSPRLCRQPSI